MCAQQTVFLFAEGDDDQHSYETTLFVIVLEARLEVSSLVMQQNCLSMAELKNFVKTVSNYALFMI